MSRPKEMSTEYSMKEPLRIVHLLEIQVFGGRKGGRRHPQNKKRKERNTSVQNTRKETTREHQRLRKLWIE